MNSEYPLYDGIGSERTVTAANQSVSGTITFEGFGQTIATTGSSSNPYMFKGGFGYRNDGDAGLHHVGARYYDAQVGRFITRDTVLSQHPYAYCEHDPINAADPSGHLAFVLMNPWTMGAAAGGATVLYITIKTLVVATAVVSGLTLVLLAGGALAEMARHNHQMGDPKNRPGPGTLKGQPPRVNLPIPPPEDPHFGLPDQRPFPGFEGAPFEGDFHIPGVIPPHVPHDGG